MELLKKEEISSVILFDLQLSESELMAFEACVRFVFEHLDSEKIEKISDCTKEELGWMQEELVSLITSSMLPQYLPSRYKSQE